MLVDANLLLYARNADDPRHGAAMAWLSDALTGPTRVGLPWMSLTAFVRIATNPRAFETPLTPEEAWQQVEEWLGAEPTWTPGPTERHREVFGDLLRRYRIVGPLVTDAALAALAIQHGVALCSTDADFARFSEIQWIDPLAENA